MLNIAVDIRTMDGDGSYYELVDYANIGEFVADIVREILFQALDKSDEL